MVYPSIVVSNRLDRDYLKGGRFTLPVGVSEDFLDNAYFQVLVSKLVDGQWQDKTNAPSHTFVMCTNATNPPCSESSRYTENQRTCCLYSIDSNANYAAPPSLDKLGNATYNITPVDITASSLHTYLNGGLNYNDSQINNIIQTSISLESNETFLSQGIRFQGVWTLPVCDVGQYGNWVADYSSGNMPCCCGPNCSETLDFWNDVGIPTKGSAQNKCKTQCSTCPVSSSANSRYMIFGLIPPFGVRWFVIIYTLVYML